MNGFDLVSYLARSENRVTVLLELATGSRSRAALQDETGIPRATLSRILAQLRDRELVVREGHDYRLTPLGTYLAHELGSLLDATAALQSLQRLREWLPFEEADIPLARLGDAEVLEPSETDPLAPIRRAESLLATGATVRLTGNSVVPSCLAIVCDRVTAGEQVFECVVSPGAVEVIAADPTMREQCETLVAAPDATLLVYDGRVPSALFVVDDVTFFAVTDDTGAIQGHVQTADPAVHEWATARIARYAEAAEPLEPGGLTV
ncbi:helix-turn-helix transcriptional regulator [Halorarius litoreus]|uniref:helix-turn-helix transcriptional regulator n=1 Tax=Halorarius litoreus TaxID=2962676 RepID=UPI0020CCD6DD|nr:ArsR family transcriptional regulator [Halorarius litoreus]